MIAALLLIPNLSFAAQKQQCAPYETSTPPFYLISDATNSDTKLHNDFHACKHQDSHNKDDKGFEACEAESKSSKKLKVSHYIPEHTIVRPITRSGSYIWNKTKTYIAVEVIQTKQNSTHTPLLETLRHSKYKFDRHKPCKWVWSKEQKKNIKICETKIYGFQVLLPAKDLKPVKHGLKGFMFVGNQGTQTKAIDINKVSSLYAPNNKDINANRDKYLSPQVFTFNTHKFLHRSPKLHAMMLGEVTGKKEVLINRAFQLVPKNGKYQTQYCGVGPDAIKYKFQLLDDNLLSTGQHFYAHVNNQFLQNITVVNASAFNDAKKFLKALDISDNKAYKNRFSDLVIWPNKLEKPFKNNSKALKEKAFYHNLVRVPTQPFLEPSGLENDKSLRLRAWGPFNSLHYVQVWPAIPEFVKHRNRVFQRGSFLHPALVSENDSIKSTMEEWRADTFIDLGTSCSFMTLLSEYEKKITKIDFSKEVSGQLSEYRCEPISKGLKPVRHKYAFNEDGSLKGYNIDKSGRVNGVGILPEVFKLDDTKKNYCPRLQWGNLYKPRQFDHKEHFRGDCYDFRLIREDSLHLATKNAGYDKNTLRDFKNMIMKTGASEVINEQGDEPDVKDLQGHDDHVHVCYDPDKEPLGNISPETACKSFLSQWNDLLTIENIDPLFANVPERSKVEKFYCEMDTSFYGQKVVSKNRVNDRKAIEKRIRLAGFNAEYAKEDLQNFEEVILVGKDALRFNRALVTTLLLGGVGGLISNTLHKISLVGASAHSINVIRGGNAITLNPASGLGRFYQRNAGAIDYMNSVGSTAAGIAVYDQFYDPNFSEDNLEEIEKRSTHLIFDSYSEVEEIELPDFFAQVDENRSSMKDDFDILLDEHAKSLLCGEWTETWAFFGCNTDGRLALKRELLLAMIDSYENEKASLEYYLEQHKQCKPTYEYK